MTATQHSPMKDMSGKMPRSGKGVDAPGARELISGVLAAL
jgi:hypothetical protein